jgi:membrane fusion protein (multidrug efflux system)
MSTIKLRPGQLLAILLLLAAAVALPACVAEDTNATTWEHGARVDENRKEEAVPVEVAALGRGGIEAVLRFSSNLEAERDVQVFAEAPRRVTELLVEEGRSVRRGQVLLRLQDDEQRSAVAKAEIDLKQRKRDFERHKDLFAQQLVTEQLYNDAAFAVEQAQIALDDARRALSYTEVKAPIAGIVTERMVNLGDHVTVNQQLFRIVDFDSIVARIYVPEKELKVLAVGQQARLRADALGGVRFRGQIDRISPIVDPATGTLKVTVATPRQEGLRPGMYVEVELVTAVHENALLLPKRALVYDNDQAFVFRLGAERRVERLRVAPLLEDALNVEPLEGLVEGDQVVVAGQSGLKDGGLVRLPDDPEPDGEKKDGEKKDEVQPDAA